MRCNIRSMRCTYRFGDTNQSTPFQIAHPVVFRMPLFMPLCLCQVQAAVLVCSCCTCLIVMFESCNVGATKVLMQNAAFQVQVPAVWSRTRYVHLSFDPVACWFIIALIIYSTLHWCTLYNVVISPLSSISHQLIFVYIICLIAKIMYIYIP